MDEVDIQRKREDSLGWLAYRELHRDLLYAHIERTKGMAIHDEFRDAILKNKIFTNQKSRRMYYGY